jgi:hypothetical protein
MSTIRFVHTDALRLGAVVSGLGECPDWLRKVASASVRTAVINSFEAAIASRCRFVLIAGRVSEYPADLETAAAWLRTHSASLRDHGIQLVIAGHPASDFPALSGLNAVLVPPGHRWDVTVTAAGQVVSSVTPSHRRAESGVLGVEVCAGAESHQRPLADLAYIAVPSVVPPGEALGSDGTVIAHHGTLSLSAGSPQAIQPGERGVFGCQLVEADMSRQTLSARFCATDVIRYSQVTLNCVVGTPTDRVADLLQERSRAIGLTGRGTTVVDWLIDGSLVWGGGLRSSLSEPELLRELREGLNAGHAGAWPRRVQLADSCSVELAAGCTRADVALTETLAEEPPAAGLAMSRRKVLPSGRAAELLTGLSLLRRAG